MGNSSGKIFDAVAIVIAVGAAIISWFSYQAACDQTDVARDIGHKDLRAYILVQDLGSDSTVHVKDSVAISFTIQNFGTTAASDVSSYIGTCYDTITPAVLPDPGERLYGQWVMAPGAKIQATERFEWTKEMYVNVFRGRAKFFVYVLVKYTDVFGDKDSTSAFAVYNPRGGNFETAGTFNYIK
jgi:hypothetical protein